MQAQKGNSPGFVGAQCPGSASPRGGWAGRGRESAARREEEKEGTAGTKHGGRWKERGPDIISRSLLLPTRGSQGMSARGLPTGTVEVPSSETPLGRGERGTPSAARESTRPPFRPPPFAPFLRVERMREERRGWIWAALPGRGFAELGGRVDGDGRAADTRLQGLGEARSRFLAWSVRPTDWRAPRPVAGPRWCERCSRPGRCPMRPTVKVGARSRWVRWVRLGRKGLGRVEGTWDERIHLESGPGPRRKTVLDAPPPPRWVWELETSWGPLPKTRETVPRTWRPRLPICAGGMAVWIGEPVHIDISRSSFSNTKLTGVGKILHT